MFIYFFRRFISYLSRDLLEATYNENNKAKIIKKAMPLKHATKNDSAVKGIVR